MGPSSKGQTFFSDILVGVRWVLVVRWRKIIFRVIRRHFLASAMDPAVSLSTYSILPIEFGH